MPTIIIEDMEPGQQVTIICDEIMRFLPDPDPPAEEDDDDEPIRVVRAVGDD